MKTKIGELKGKPLILSTSDNIVNKHELVVSINETNDKIKDIRRREGGDLLSILDIKGGDISTNYDYVIYDFSSGTLERVSTVLPLPECSNNLGEELTILSNTIGSHLLKISMSKVPSKEALEYVENYKKYLENDSNFTSVTASLSEELDKNVAILTFNTSTSAQRLKFYPDKII